MECPMSDKQRSTSADYLVYFAMRTAVCVIQALPFAVACRFADFMAWLIYRVDKRHRQVARDNLGQAFPAEHTEAELDVLIRKVYGHFCLMLMEILFLPRLVHHGN